MDLRNQATRKSQSIRRHNKLRFFPPCLHLFSRLFLCPCVSLSYLCTLVFVSPSSLRKYPEGKDKLNALYIRIVAPFPEMERFLQDTIKRSDCAL